MLSTPLHGTCRVKWCKEELPGRQFGHELVLFEQYLRLALVYGPNGAPAVAKASRTEHQRRGHEAAVLAHERLQSAPDAVAADLVPPMIADTTALVLGDAVPVLVCPFVGPRNAESLDARTLGSAELRDRAEAIVRAVHAKGVTHGDLALRNFVVPAPRGAETEVDAAARLTLVDFELATLDPTEEEKDDELATVRGLFSGSQTGETTVGPSAQ